MSKPVKELLRREFSKRFEGLTSLAVVSLVGVDANQTNAIRSHLRQKDIRLTVVKNAMARQAFRAMGMDEAAKLIEGPSAIAYGGDNVVTVVRELLSLRETAPALTVKAAMMEGESFPSERIEELSKYPTRDEAIAKVVACVLAPGAKLAAAAVGPGAVLAGALKTIQKNLGGGQEGQAA